jgi:hypothetical protein
MTRLIRVDASPSSAVYVCALCGCRDVATHRGPVMTAAAAHLRIAHPGVEGAAREAAMLAHRAPTRRPDTETQ